MDTPKKELYTVKYFDKNEWHYLPSEHLNPFDTTEQKRIELQRIREKNNLAKGIYINVSSFFNVYW